MKVKHITISNILHTLNGGKSKINLLTLLFVLIESNTRRSISSGFNSHLLSVSLGEVSTFHITRCVIFPKVLSSIINHPHCGF